MQKERGTERLIAFSDAVVAIAITLVVLPLVDTARDHEGPVETFFHENAGAVAAAALSFVVIANLWQVHHGAFERFDGMTRGMVRANLLWLAAIAFLPLPTVLLVETSNDDRLGVVLYIGTMLVAAAAMSVIAEIAERRGLDHGDGSDSPCPRRWHRWSSTVLMAIALLLAALVPGVGAWALLVLLVSIPVDGIRHRRHRDGRA